MLEVSNREKIIKVSRERYGTQRDIVNEKISRWTGAMETKSTPVPRAVPQQQSQSLYDAQCQSCGRWTKVVFAPDGSRPVYCKTCLKKIKKDREEQAVQKPATAPPKPEPQVESPSSLREAIEKETVSFSSKPQEKPKPKRKEVNLEELKKTLEESLEDLPEKDEKPQESQPKERGNFR
jgi:CxxC-x17-CxxC domain-containing protein